MRNIHNHLTIGYGREMNQNFCQWEKLEMKMVDFSNNRRFSLRCLNEGLIPVSIKLRTNIRTPKGLYIVRKAEKSLLNERIRSINNTIAMLKMQVYTWIHNLEETLDKKSMEECYKFVDNKREYRHFKTMKHQIRKFERLQQKNNQIKGGCSNEHEDHEHSDHEKTIETSQTNNQREKNINPNKRKIKNQNGYIISPVPPSQKTK